MNENVGTLLVGRKYSALIGDKWGVISDTALIPFKNAERFCVLYISITRNKGGEQKT